LEIRLKKVNGFKKWLIPVAIVCLLLASLVGCSNAPASLGQIFDPSGNPFANRFTDVSDLRTATYVVAASDSVHKFEADYFCNGTNDHVQIQAALDKLPATGGEVFLLDGTYNIEESIVMDSYQTLRGCGRNTILTTTTANKDIIEATGGDGTEKEGLLIADLCVDGNAGGVVNDKGIEWTYVDHSKISNIWALNNGEEGIFCITCDFNEIINNFALGNGRCGINLEGETCDFNIVTGNTCQDNTQSGIQTYYYADNAIVSNNICQGNGEHGIIVYMCDHTNVTDNMCQGNTLDGIYLNQADSNKISGNVIQLNGAHGIYLGGWNCDDNAILDNIILENSQTTNITCDNIHLDCAIRTFVAFNYLRAGALANKPRYGIAIIDSESVGNRIIDNDLYDSGVTAKVYDEGTGTIGLSVVVPFSDGTEPLDSGYLIDADTELARAFLFLPEEVQQVRYLKIYARGLTTEADAMRLEINVNGGADNQVYTTHQTLAPNTPSTSTNIAADDVIYWTLTSAQILALATGDSIEVKALHEDAGGADVETNAYFRTVEIGYF